MRSLSFILASAFIWAPEAVTAQGWPPLDPARPDTTLLVALGTGALGKAVLVPTDSLVPAGERVLGGDAPGVWTESPGAARTLGRARRYMWLGTLGTIGTGLALAVNNSSDQAVLNGYILIVVGGTFGPSAGHVYLGDVRRALIGVGIRVVGVGAAVAVASTADGLASIGAFLLAAPAAVIVGSLYNITTLGVSARERGIALGPGLDARTGAPLLTLSVRP